MRIQRKILTAGAAAFLALQAGAANARAEWTPIKGDEDLVFFSSAAHLNPDGTRWIVPVKGRIFEPEAENAARKKLGALVRDALKVQNGSPEDKILQERLKHFWADNQSGKTVAIRAGATNYPVAESDGDGQFRGSIEIPRQDAAELSEKGTLSFSAATRSGQTRTFAGKAILVPRQGLSIISDIDDTVKITNVRDRNETIANTFLRPFREVPGMSKLYREIADSRPDARFHFVSGSPWQLYRPLRELLDESKFPEASFHLKTVSFDGKTLADLFAEPSGFKIPTISSLLEKYPGRKFLLIGDSGEQDPEVYAEIYRKFPGQVEGVFIRDVTGEPATSARHQKTFAGIPADKWRIFREPEELRPSMQALLAKSPESECASCGGVQRRPADPTKPIFDVIDGLSR